RRDGSVGTTPLGDAGQRATAGGVDVAKERGDRRVALGAREQLGVDPADLMVEARASVDELPAQVLQRIPRHAAVARRYGLTELVDQKRADGLDQRVFAGEVVQQRAVIDAGFTRDVGKSQP